MAKLFESMKETTGIDLKEIVRAGSYDAKVNRNLNVRGLTLPSSTEAVQETEADPAATTQDENEPVAD